MRIVLTRLEEDMKAIGMPPPPAAKKQPPQAAAPAAPAQAPAAPMPPEDEEGIDPTDPNMTGMGGDMGDMEDAEDPLAGVGDDAQPLGPVPMPPEDEAAPAPAPQCSCAGGQGAPMEGARQRMQRRYGESRRGPARPAKPAAPARRQESFLSQRTTALLESVRQTLGEIRGTHLDEARRGFGLLANNAFYLAKGLERAAYAKKSVQMSETSAAMKRLSTRAKQFVESLDSRQITVAEASPYFTRYFSAVVEAADLYDRLVEDDEDDEGGETDKKGKDKKNKMSAWNDREPVEPGENTEQPTEGDDSEDEPDDDPDAELEDEEPPFVDDGDGEDEEPAEESRKGRNFRGGSKRR